MSNEVTRSHDKNPAEMPETTHGGRMHEIAGGWAFRLDLWGFEAVDCLGFCPACWIE